MVTDELTSTIKERFRQGARRKEIKDELLNQGWTEEDIDAAMSQIQHDVIKQLPIVASMYQLLNKLESKTNLTSPQMTAVVMAVCVGILLLLAGGLYFFLDPLDARSIDRDKQRETDVVRLRTAIDGYYKKNLTYPDALPTLVPDYLPAVPLDPQSGASYSYKTLDSANNYELCITFEMQSIQCISAKPVDSVIPVVPTPTQVPVFVPASASGSAG